MPLSKAGCDPMEFLRDLFRHERVLSCAEVATAEDGQRAKTAGVVLVRQMPGTAGVVFITLRDETGVCNIVVWPRVFDQFRKERAAADDRRKNSTQPRGCCSSGL